MPKNKGKGGKNRRRGKNEGEEKRELVTKEDGQEYASVVRMLGNGHLDAYCFDGVQRLCHIRGKMRKKVWVNTGDIILISLREFQDGKADVILKYTPDEARKLLSLGEIPNTTKINEEEGGDDIVEFNYQEENEAVDSEDSASDSSGDEGGNSKSFTRGAIPRQFPQAGMLPPDDSESSSSEEEIHQPKDAKDRSKKPAIDIDKI